MRKIVAIALFLALGACQLAGGTTTTLDGAGAQKAVYAAKASYAAALTVAVAYNELPRCNKPAAPIVCSDVNAVAQLRKADQAASAALDSAETGVRQLGSSPTVLTAAVIAAQRAVEAYGSIVALYQPKK